MPTCMTALNQQVLPTFFSPTGQLSILFLSCGLGESLHTSVWVRFRLALFSAMLASNTLQEKGKTGIKNDLQLPHDLQIPWGKSDRMIEA